MRRTRLNSGLAQAMLHNQRKSTEPITVLITMGEPRVDQLGGSLLGVLSLTAAASA